MYNNRQVLYACVRAFVLAFFCVPVCVCMYVFMYVCMYVYMYVCVCMYVCMYACTYVCVFFLNIYLLACSITLLISNTTCYLQLVFTMIVPSLLFVYSMFVLQTPSYCLIAVLLMFYSVLYVHFFDFISLFSKFC